MQRTFVFLILICVASSVVALSQAAGGASQTGSGVIRIATVNLLNFGFGESSCKASQFGTLVDVLRSYDVVSCQEVMPASDNGQVCYGCEGSTCHMDKLVGAMSEASGRDWEYRLAGPFKYVSRYEYYAVLYDASVVTFLDKEGTAENIAGSPKFLVRPPFWADFRSGNFDFTLIDYHAPSADSSVSTDSELVKLGAFLDALQAADPNEQDLILAGDLNSEMPSLPHDWGTACRTGLDFVILDPTYTAELVPPCGTDTRLEDLGLTDHPIVWALFDTTKLDDDGPEATAMYSLTLAVSPSGAGTIAPVSPQTYSNNASVPISATPNPGFQFDHWEGDASGTASSITVTMTEDKSITAVFTPRTQGPCGRQGEYQFDFSTLRSDTLPSFLRQGVVHDVDITTQKTAVEMYLQGWQYTMPQPKSAQARWCNADGRTTWWYGYWSNAQTSPAQMSTTLPQKDECGIYIGDGQDLRGIWRRGGTPPCPTALEWLLSDTGGPSCGSCCGTWCEK